MNIDTALLKSRCADIGVELDSPALEKFDLFAGMLIETNKKFNLTAIKEPDDIINKHFADSLTLLKFVDLPKGAKVLDVGTGAGFPGVPLLIARPDIELTMLDSTGKKLNFVRESVEALGLNADCVHARAEDYARTEARESFDVVTSRAVAAMNVLCEYCLPFVRQGGIFAPLKGARAQEETDPAKNAIKTLGGKLISVNSLTLADGGERNIIIIKKTAPCPEKYPRPGAQIAKKQL